MFYYLVRWLVKFALLFLGLKYEGIHNLPKKGAAIIVANHVSFWDPLLVAVASPRPVHFMAKAELYQNQILARLFTALNAFPVKRGQADRNAIRKALKLLESGQILGIFPEGTRKKEVEMEAAQSGAAMLALKSGAQLIPAACVGTRRRFPWGWGRNTLMVRFGKPLDLTAYQQEKTKSASLDQISKEIMREINKLLYE
ncbi:MAG: 1-acyl-sn-glycerol-3-phosphate acyltransferase [Syntrophomonadaceae bacterium]|jgi:1-acyl-sn-glycerol-3-phosphate acyltransferase|nr:1-acyl-sn-glycerol-3-phosphate acyltransferase [Syntrophomonadaceae bacterium]